MSAWWIGIPAAEAVLQCGGHSHTLRWERGTLSALDHGDPEDEATLAALAGESFACLDALRAWQRRRDDPRALTLGSRGPGDALHIDPDRQPHPIARPRRRAETELTDLLALGGGLPDRLQASVAATWARRLGSGHRALADTRPQLYAALYGRILVTLRTWLGEPTLTIALTMIDGLDDHPIKRSEHGLTVDLPFSWVAEVWAKGLALVFGRLCVTAESADGVRWTLATVGADLGATENLALELAPPERPAVSADSADSSSLRRR